MMFRQQVHALLFLFGINGVSAGFFSHWSFSSLLYEMHICTIPMRDIGLCPKFPCNRPGPWQDHDECANWICEDTHQHPLDHDYQCLDISDCLTFTDAVFDQCVSDLAEGSGSFTSGYYNDASYVDSGSAAQDTYSTSGGGFTNPESMVSANWLAYAILGALLTAFILVVIWRRRGKIENDDLSEDLEPQHGENLQGAVARHMAKAEVV